MGQIKEGLKRYSTLATVGTGMVLTIDAYQYRDHSLVLQALNKVRPQALAANSDNQLSPEVLTAVSSPVLEEIVNLSKNQPILENEPTPTYVTVPEKNIKPVTTPNIAKPAQIKPTVVPTKPPVMVQVTPEPVTKPNIVAPTPTAQKPEAVSKPAINNPGPNSIKIEQRLDNKEDYIALFVKLTGAPRAKVESVMLCESGFNPRAQNASGASGLMQIMPVHAPRFSKRGWNYESDKFDPIKNLTIAAEIYKESGWGPWVCK